LAVEKPLLLPNSINLTIFQKKVLHLGRIAVISHLRTNFTECPGIAFTREPRELNQGRRGGESESPEEEAIEIGNSYRTL
jgi:hypothetical protein